MHWYVIVHGGRRVYEALQFVPRILDLGSWILLEKYRANGKRQTCREAIPNRNIKKRKRIGCAAFAVGDRRDVETRARRSSFHNYLPSSGDASERCRSVYPRGWSEPVPRTQVLRLRWVAYTAALSGLGCTAAVQFYFTTRMAWHDMYLVLDVRVQQYIVPGRCCTEWVRCGVGTAILDHNRCPALLSSQSLSSSLVIVVERTLFPLC